MLARGIVGTRGDVPFVASPMHKQAFDLRTGQCLDDADVSGAGVRRAGGRRRRARGLAGRPRHETSVTHVPPAHSPASGSGSPRPARWTSRSPCWSGAGPRSSGRRRCRWTPTTSTTPSCGPRPLDVLDRPVDMFLATTGIGMKAWFAAAERWGLLPRAGGGDREAEILARGPKSVGALRRRGLRELWAPESECFEDVLAHLRGRDLAGLRIVVQEHGQSLSMVAHALRRQGADVTVVTVYRVAGADDPEPMFRLIDLIADRQLDAVTFTSAPAVAALMEAAGVGRRDEVVAAFQADVVASCVGPVTAAAFEMWGVPTIFPERSRLAAMVKQLETELPSRRDGTALDVAGHLLLLHGDEVLLDGVPVRLSAGAARGAPGPRRQPRPRGLPRATARRAAERDRGLRARRRDGGRPAARGDRHPARADRGQARVPAGGPVSPVRTWSPWRTARVRGQATTSPRVTARAAPARDPGTASFVELSAPLFADVVATASRSPPSWCRCCSRPASTCATTFPPRSLPSPHEVVLGSVDGAAPAGGRGPGGAAARGRRRPGQPVVMVAAGSRDPDADPDLTRAAALLQATWGGPVRWRRWPGAVTARAGRRAPRGRVSPYLLAPGHFATRARTESAAGASSSPTSSARTPACRTWSPTASASPSRRSLPPQARRVGAVFRWDHAESAVS